MDALTFANLTLNGIVEGLIIALPAVALTLVFGVMRFANAATGEVMTLGAYGAQAAQLALGGSMVLATFVGMAGTALLSLLFYRLLFRHYVGRPNIYSLVASIGLAFACRSALTFFLGYDQKVFQVPLVRAVPVGPLLVIPTDLWIGLASLVAIAGVFAILYATPLGRRMRAVADDPDLARTCGINADRVLGSMWLIAGAISALAGILLGIKTVITPLMGWEMLLPAFAAMILGGIGNPAGAIAGALLIGAAQELSTPFVGFTYKIAVGLGIMFVVLMWRPGGLFGAAARVR